MKVSIFLTAVAFLTAPLAAQQSGFLGVSLSPGEEGGAVVSEVHEGTAASVAGLKSGDVILAVDGEKVRSVEGFVKTVGSHMPGDFLRLTVRRKGEVMKKGVILGRRPKNLEGAPQARELFEQRSPRGERRLRWSPGGEDIEIQLDDLGDLEEHMDELHAHLEEMGLEDMHIQIEGLEGLEGMEGHMEELHERLQGLGGHGRVLKLEELGDLGGAHGILRMKDGEWEMGDFDDFDFEDFDMEGFGGDFKIMMHDGEGLKSLKGMDGKSFRFELGDGKGKRFVMPRFEGMRDGKNFTLKMGDGQGRRMVIPQRGGSDDEDVFRYEIRSESKGGDVDDFMKSLNIEVPDGADAEVQIVLPYHLEKSVREHIEKQLRKKFGDDASIEFHGDGFKARIQGGSGGNVWFSDDEDVRFGEPIEIDVEEIHGDGDVRVLFGDKQEAGKAKPRGEWKKKPAKGTGQASKAAFYHDLDEAYSASRASGKPVLIDFYADWCGPCRRFGDEVLTSSEHSDLVSQFIIAKIDVDANGALAEEFGVQGIPDVRIHDAGGNEIMKIVGYGGAANSRKQLQDALSKSTNRTSGRATNADAKRRAELKERIARLRKEIAEMEGRLESPHTSTDEF